MGPKCGVAVLDFHAYSPGGFDFARSGPRLGGHQLDEYRAILRAQTAGNQGRRAGIARQAFAAPGPNGGEVGSQGLIADVRAYQTLNAAFGLAGFFCLRGL